MYCSYAEVRECNNSSCFNYFLPAVFHPVVPGFPSLDTVGDCTATSIYHHHTARLAFHAPLNALPENSDEDASLTYRETNCSNDNTTVSSTAKITSPLVKTIGNSPANSNTKEGDRAIASYNNSADIVSKSGTTATTTVACDTPITPSTVKTSGNDGIDLNASKLSPIKNSSKNFHSHDKCVNTATVVSASTSKLKRNVDNKGDIFESSLAGSKITNESVYGTGYNSEENTSTTDLRRDYEPLKSVQLLRNMGKSLSLYLPKYSLESDSEVENL